MAMANMSKAETTAIVTEAVKLVAQAQVEQKKEKHGPTAPDLPPFVGLEKGADAEHSPASLLRTELGIKSDVWVFLCRLCGIQFPATFKPLRLLAPCLPVGCCAGGNQHSQCLAFCFLLSML